MNETCNVITPTWAMGMISFPEEAEYEPVTEAELRQHLRVEENIDTDYLMRLARMARHAIERFTNRSWTEQVIAVECTVQRAILPLPLSSPLQSIEQVAYIDSSGVVRDIDPALYTINYDTIPISIDLTAAPAANRYVVLYRAGYKVQLSGPPDQRHETPPPDDIKHAILIMARWAYQHPDGMMPDTKYKSSGGNVPLMVQTLCSPYRWEMKGW